MAIALSVLARCGPCVKYHVRKAKEEGFSPDGNRRSRLDGDRLRRLADDDVLQRNETGLMLPELSNMLSWWQWAILAAVPPAIVLLYFLKLKRRPLEVPSTYLWHKSIEDLHVNSIWQRLRNNLLLYLQLAVVLFIVLALLRPSWQALRLSGSRLVLLIDNSASMQATDVKPSRLEEAKRRVGELIDQMHSGDSAMLISFSDTARVEQNFTDNRQQLREALAAIKPSQHSTNLSEALKLAAGLVNPGQANENSTDLHVAGTKLFIFSDGRFPAGRRTSSWATSSRLSCRSAVPTRPTWASWPSA